MLYVLSEESQGMSPRESFLGAAPTGLVEELARVVEVSMKTAWTQGLSFPPGIRHDKFGYDFRFNIEAALINLANTYKGQVETREVKNEIENWSHTEVRFGPVVLTANAVETPQTMVRDATFRRTLAKDPQQPLGLVELEPDPPSNGLYAVLLYPSARFPMKADEAVPSFVTVRFPMSDLSDWLPDQVNALRALQERRKREQPGTAPRLDEQRDRGTG